MWEIGTITYSKNYHYYDILLLICERLVAQSDNFVVVAPCSTGGVALLKVVRIILYVCSLKVRIILYVCSSLKVRANNSFFVRLQFECRGCEEEAIVSSCLYSLYCTFAV